MFTVFFTSGCFTTGLERQAAFPQGLKPTILLLRIGTAKAMPFQNRVMKQRICTAEVVPFQNRVMKQSIGTAKAGPFQNRAVKQLPGWSLLSSRCRRRILLTNDERFGGRFATFLPLIASHDGPATVKLVVSSCRKEDHGRFGSTGSE